MATINTQPAPTLLSQPFQLEHSKSLLLRAWIISGLIFMVLPGTLLGFSNLLAISNHHGLSGLSAAWIQGHGHAQVFGWMGSFILGIGFYSFPKSRLSTGYLPWTALGLWVSAVALRWTTNIYLWHWRVLLPLTATFEVITVLIFLRTASTHKRAPAANANQQGRQGIEPWMFCVLTGNAFMLAALVMNLIVCSKLALHGADPAFPHGLDQKYLVLLGWGFLVPMIWGFSARWMPGFIHTRPATPKTLRNALILQICGVLAGVSGYTLLATMFFVCAALVAIQGIHIFQHLARPVRSNNQFPEYPVFFRLAYLWLLIAGSMSIWAALADTHGGIWGASRHALTVGFAATMVMSVGPRILPHFGGVRKLFSKRLMLLTLITLLLGCSLRVSTEPLAYEGFSQTAWKILPFSGVFELTAVILFAVNIGLTFLLGAPLIPQKELSGSN